MEIWLSKSVTFNPAIISESDRIISGVATAPIYDRENELITREAVEKALPDFMVCPVLTYNHLEFPIGIVTKAEFDSKNQLIIEAKIKKGSSVDDIWNMIKSGELNSFSISGRRVESTCTGDGNPCITKALHLNAITICGDNRCNPAATFVVKSDNMEEETNKLDELTNLVKTVSESVISLSSKVDSLQKAEDKKEEDKKEEPPKEEDDMKKSLEDMSKTVSELSELVKSLTGRIEAVENRKIEKTMITINDNGEPIKATITPMESYAKHMFGGSKF